MGTFSKLHVTGALSLAGTLTVNLTNGFTPMLGNSFDILDWGTHTGKFSTVDLPALSTGLAWSTLHFGDNGTLAVVDQNLVPGDLNHDLQVTVADISALMTALSNLNGFETSRGITTNAQLLQVADINGDGVVNNLDLQSLISEEANSIIGSVVIGGSGSGGATLVAVPEPASISLLFLGGIAALLVHRRRTVK